MSGRIKLLSACAAALAAASPAYAQQGLQPCRVTFQETLRAGDVSATQGEVKFGPIMPQAGGGFVAQGTGEASITFTPGPGGCTVVSGSPHTARFQGMMISEDGRTTTTGSVTLHYCAPFERRTPS